MSNPAAKRLTTNREVAYPTGPATRGAGCLVLACVVIALAAGLPEASAQGDASNRAGTSPQAARRVVPTATIHWQDVPLRDAISRLEKLFATATFLDRRIDPTERVNLEMSASSAEQVLTQIGGEHGWSARRVGGVVYMGPADAARQLAGVIAARRADVARLPPSQRAVFSRKSALSWPRLTRPRELVTELVKRNGWRVADAERIPHDLWASERLDGLTFQEQLTLLLVGFDLTYAIQSETRTIQILKLDKTAIAAGAEDSPSVPTAQTPPAAQERTTKQVFSLRVADKPVGAVMRELARRLNWQVEFDDAAIQAAGRSLEARVSFAVENVEQDELLQAVLGPAGLTFQREAERIKIVPQ